MLFNRLDSLSRERISQIANQMINPQVYDPRIPPAFDKSDPLYLLTQPLNANATGDSNVIECKSAGGKLAFKVIAKNRKWNKDFWNDLAQAGQKIKGQAGT